MPPASNGSFSMLDKGKTAVEAGGNHKAEFPAATFIYFKFNYLLGG